MLKEIFVHRYTVFVFRIVLGALFLYAGYEKILYPEAFAKAIANYRLLPSVFIGLLATFLPWLELLCGFLLIAGVFTRSSALLVSFMLFVFIMAIASALVRGLDIQCGCFDVSGGGERTGLSLLVRDLLFLAMSMQVLLFDRGFFSFEPLLRNYY
ncbi:MAG: MauE/DoxX family redox-associated membrane protein [bacterium]